MALRNSQLNLTRNPKSKFRGNCNMDDKQVTSDLMGFFNVRNMKDLFDSVTPSTIPLYVKAIGLFFKM